MFPFPTSAATATQPSALARVPAKWAAPRANDEQLLLIKHMARLQKQMSQLVLGYESQLQHWKHQLMRQSTQLMLERTRGDWGIAGGDRVCPSAAPHAKVSHTVAHAEAEALICRTGCVMDEHHWRDGELCKRSGQVCALGGMLADDLE